MWQEYAPSIQRSPDGANRNPGRRGFADSHPRISLALHPGYARCKEKHLHRYLAEFDFRHNARVALGVNDAERTDLILWYRWQAPHLSNNS